MKTTSFMLGTTKTFLATSILSVSLLACGGGGSSGSTSGSGSSTGTGGGNTPTVSNPSSTVFISKEAQIRTPSSAYVVFDTNNASPAKKHAQLAATTTNSCFTLVTGSNGKTYSTTQNSSQWYSTATLDFTVKNTCSTAAAMSSLVVQASNFMINGNTAHVDWIAQGAGDPYLTLTSAISGSNLDMTISTPECTGDYCSWALVPAGSTKTFTINTSANEAISSFGVSKVEIIGGGSDNPPVDHAKPGNLSVKVDTNALKPLCTATTACKIGVNVLTPTGAKLDEIYVNPNESPSYTVTYNNVLTGNYALSVDTNSYPSNNGGTISFAYNPANGIVPVTSDATSVSSVTFSYIAPKPIGNLTITAANVANPAIFANIGNLSGTAVNVSTQAKTSFLISLGGSVTLNNLPAGAYTINTQSIADPATGTYYTASKNTATVVTGKTATQNVTFTQLTSGMHNVSFVVSGAPAGQTVAYAENGANYKYNTNTLVNGTSTYKFLSSSATVALTVNDLAGYTLTVNPAVITPTVPSVTITYVATPVDPVVIPVGAVPLNNNSSFFLHAQNNSPNQSCPAMLSPGQKSYIYPSKNGSWASSCYYLVCSAKDYDKDQGCMEKTPDGSMNQGGYLAWINLNADPIAPSCGLPGYDVGTNSFACSIDTKGNFNFKFSPITQKYSAGTSMGQLVSIPSVKSAYTVAPGLKYRGINISGYEYDGTVGDAMYQRPDLPDVKYFAQKGMNTIRLPIRWEFVVSDDSSTSYYNLITTSRLSPSDSNSVHINTMYIAGLKDTVSKYLANGFNVIVDMHDYLRFCPTGSNGVVNVGQQNEPTNPPEQSGCSVVTAADAAYVWTALATELAPLAKQYNITSTNQLMFGLQNEPYSQAGQLLKTQDVFNIEVASAKAIRTLGLNNRVIFSGNYWDPLHGFPTFVPNDGAAAPGDVANGQMFTKANFDKAGIDVSGIALEVHQYFDSNYSGRSEVCNVYTSYEDFKAKLDLNTMPKWMNDNHMQVMLSEFGAGDNAQCQQDLSYMMQYLEENSLGQANQPNGGFIGWQLWRGNRHNVTVGFGAFSYLDAADYNVYGGSGSKANSAPGTGINQGAANGLIDKLYVNHLK